MSKDDTVLRKKRQLDVCLEGGTAIESAELQLFNKIRFVHNALPELDSRQIDTSVDFLGYRISLPLFISCMTGGSAQGFRANVDLAKAAEGAGIPVGMGSFRILLEKPELSSHFELKKYAPSVPVMGNIGIVQIRDVPSSALLGIAADLGADALAVHINPGQELIQRGGDRDFRGLKDALGDFIARSSLPVIVKETGCGFTPALINEFTQMGAALTDVAGGGGTNWMRVEGEINPDGPPAGEFAQWGIPTAVILSLCGKTHPLLASGGIRTGMDAVKSVALGAAAAGMAGPFIRGVSTGGAEKAAALIEGIRETFRTAMALTGAENVQELRKVPLVFESDFLHLAEQYREAVYE